MAMKGSYQIVYLFYIMIKKRII